MRSINFFSVLLILSAIMFLPFTTKAQVTIGSTDTPHEFSILELFSSGERGFRLPQLTTDQRNDMGVQYLTGNDSIAAMGLQIFNTTNFCVETWNGERWISFCRSDGDDTGAGDDGVNIGGVFWARSNVDLSTPTGFAPNPQDPGMFFRLGNNRGWRSYGEPAWWNGSGWTEGGWDDPESDPFLDAEMINDEHPAIHAWLWNNGRGPCPPGWRLPSIAEALSFAQYIQGWYSLGGRYGFLLGGDGDEYVFFPAVGQRLYDTGAISDVGATNPRDDKGSYWAPTLLGEGSIIPDIPPHSVVVRVGGDWISAAFSFGVDYAEIPYPYVSVHTIFIRSGSSVRCVRPVND